VSYTAGQGTGEFTATIKVTNTGRTPISAWAIRFRYTDGQQITAEHDTAVHQAGTDVTLSNLPTNGTIGAGRSRTLTLTATWAGANSAPAEFSLNTTACSTE
jgi:hypothetical protein